MRKDPKSHTSQRFWIKPLILLHGKSSYPLLKVCPYSNFPKRKQIIFIQSEKIIYDRKELKGISEKLPFVYEDEDTRNNNYLRYFDDELQKSNEV